MEIINNRYRVIKSIKQNRLVSSYLVSDMMQGYSEIQLNILNTEYIPETLIDYYTKEFIILHHLENANLIKDYNFGTIFFIDNKKTNGEQYFFTCEYIEDSNEILNYIKEKSPFDILNLFVQICGAAGYLHLKGLIYGELNLNNIILEDSKREPRIILKDIATVEMEKYNYNLEKLEETYFKSPYLLAGKKPSTASDIYSLGALLLVLLGKKGINSFDVRNDIHSLHGYLKDKENENDQYYHFYKNIIGIIERMTTLNSEEEYEYVVDIINDINAVFNKNYNILNREEIERLNFHTKIIGRDLEIKDIITSYDNMIRNEPGKKVFIVHGETGCGKTRFLEEIKYLLEIKKANVYESFALNTLSESNNKVWIDILRKITAESDADTIEKYEYELMKFFPEIIDRKLSISSELSGKEVEKYRLLNRITGFVGESIKNKPAVIIIDNIHYANEFSLDTIYYLYNEIIKNRNIMIILTYNDSESFKNKKFAEYISVLKSKMETDIINLTDLTYEQTAIMVRSMLSMSYTPYKLSERIYAQSYGNPLFVSEIIKNLFSRKIVYTNKETGRWNSDYDSDEDYKYLPIPNSMELTIINQMKNWSKLGHEILKIISVFSSPVSISELCNFVNYEEKIIENEVNELVLNGVLLKKIGDRSLVYEISNKILKNIVYDKIGSEEKIEKHKFAAKIIEEGYDLEIGENIEELIHHLEKAGIKEKVIKYCCQNAKRLEALKNREDQIKNLEKALFTFGDDDNNERLELLINIGNLYFDDGDVETALDYFSKAEKLSKSFNNQQYRIDSASNLANVYYSRNDIKNLVKYIKKIKKLLEGYDYKKGYLECRRFEAIIKIVNQDYEQAANICREALNLCGDDFDKLKGEFYRILGNVYIRSDNAKESLECSTMSLRYFEKAKYVNGIILSLNSMGVIHLDLYQDDDTALEYFYKVRDISKENDIISRELLGNINIAETHFKRSDYEAAYKYLKEALEMARKVDYEGDIFYCYNILIRVCVELNNYREAYDYYLLSSKELADHPEQGRDVGEYYRSSAELFYALGKYDESHKYLKQCMKFYLNEDAFMSINNRILDSHLKIIKGEFGPQFEDSITKIIEIANKFVTPENKVKVLCKTAVLLKKSNFSDYSKGIMLEVEKLIIGPMPDIVNVIRMYADGILSSGREALETLLLGLETAKKLKHKNYIQSISTSIADYYFLNENYYYAANYYIEACEIIKELVLQVPEEFKLSFINSDNMAAPFRKLELIKDCIKYGRCEINNEPLDHKVVNNLELRRLLDNDEVNEFLTDRNFIESIRELYMSFLPKGISSEKDIITNMGSDTIKNLELIVKYLSGVTLATRGIIATEEQNHEISVIASSNNNHRLPYNKYLFERVKTTMEPILISERANRVDSDTALLSKGIKACLCIPIMSKPNYDDKEIKVERRKLPNQRLSVRGYLYLESDRLLNNFNINGLQKCLEFTGFLDLLIEKHQLMRTSSIDKLTGALTRKYLEDALTEEIERSSISGKPFSIIMYDLDHFKSVNDRFGHQVGDDVLRRVSQTVKNNIRRDDLLGRYGGEEFVVILPDTNIDDGALVAEELRQKIQNEKILGDKGEVTVSMGIASYPLLGQWKQELIEKADQALYVAKESGRNRCQVWNSGFSNKVKRTDKLNGIISGNTVADSRNVLVLVEIIELINKDILKQDKIYSLLGRIIEIIEAQYGLLLMLEDNNVIKRYGRKAFNEEWADSLEYNRRTIDTVIQKKQGVYMIDWDDIGSHDLITGIPDWKSVIAVPVIRDSITKGVLYLSVSTRSKEFGFNEFNFVNILCELIAAII